MQEKIRLKYGFFLVLLVLSVVPVGMRAEGRATDSLRILLKAAMNDTVKADILVQLGEQFYRSGNYGEALKNYNESLKKSEEVKFRRGIATASNGLGAVYEALGNYSEAVKVLFTALKIFEEMGEKLSAVSAYINIALIHVDIKNYKEALKNCEEALALGREAGDKMYIGYIYNTFGITYYYQGNFPMALKSHIDALKLRIDIGDKGPISDSYINLGVVYYELGLAAKKIGDTDSVEICLNTALKNYEAARAISAEIKSASGIAGADVNLGSLYLELGQLAEAGKRFGNALLLYEEMGSIEGLKEAYSGLSQVYEQSGRSGKALEYYRRYIIFRDSLVNEMNIKKTVQSQMRYQFEKKEAAARLEQEKKDLITQAENRKQRIILFSVSGFGLMVLLMAGLIFRNLRINQKKNGIIQAQKELVEQQKSMVEEKQKEILDSIYYARRIQRSLLPSERYLQKIFKSRR